MDLRVGDTEEIVAQVRDNSLMLGVVGARFEAAELHFEPIVGDSLVFVMTPELYSRFRRLETDRLLRSVPWVTA